MSLLKKTHTYLTTKSKIMSVLEHSSQILHWVILLTISML